MPTQSQRSSVAMPTYIQDSRTHHSAVHYGSRFLMTTATVFLDAFRFCHGSGCYVGYLHSNGCYTVQYPQNCYYEVNRHGSCCHGCHCHSNHGDRWQGCCHGDGGCHGERRSTDTGLVPWWWAATQMCCRRNVCGYQGYQSPAGLWLVRRNRQRIYNTQYKYGYYGYNIVVKEKKYM